MNVPAGGLDYTVQPGDTLLGIAIRYGLDWQDIAIANNLSEDDLLQIGQVLRVPSIGGIGGPVEAATSAAVAGKQRYTVSAGDTLFTIALRYNITWQELAAINNLQEHDLLQIGQELALPASLDADGASATSAVAAKAVTDTPHVVQDVGDARMTGSENERRQTSAGTYTVQAGDTPLGIALSHNTSLDALLRANDLTASDFLQIGQVLTIPGAETVNPPATAAAVAPAERYTVQRGDTVFAIAARLGVDWQEMLRINQLTEQSLLQPGQTLAIP
jgi:lysozyme